MTLNTPKIVTTLGRKDQVWKYPDLDPESPGERAEGYLFRGTLRLDFDEWPMADGHSASHATNPGVIGGNVLLGSLARSAPLIILRDASAGNPVSALANNEERRARFPSRIFAVLSLPSVLLAEISSCKFGFLNSRFKQHKSTTPKVIIGLLDGGNSCDVIQQFKKFTYNYFLATLTTHSGHFSKKKIPGISSRL